MSSRRPISRTPSCCSVTNSSSSETRWAAADILLAALDDRPGDARVQAFVLDEALAQLARGFQPVRAVGQVHAAGAHPVHLRLVHTGRRDAVLVQGLGGGDQPPA